jgi:hypothetical protein
MVKEPTNEPFPRKSRSPELGTASPGRGGSPSTAVQIPVLAERRRRPRSREHHGLDLSKPRPRAAYPSSGARSLLSSSIVASLGQFIPIGLHGASASFSAACMSVLELPRFGGQI